MTTNSVSRVVNMSASVRPSYTRHSKMVTKARIRVLDRIVKAVEKVNQTREQLAEAAIFGTEAQYKKAAAAHERAVQARCKALNVA